MVTLLHRTVQLYTCNVLDLVPVQLIRTYRYDVSTASNRCSQSPSHSQIALYEGDWMMGVITPMNLTSYTVWDGSTGAPQHDGALDLIFGHMIFTECESTETLD